MKKEANQQKNLIDLLSEILKWTKFIGKQKLKILLEDALKEDLEKVIYELSDGKSLREMEKICKANGFSVSHATIGNYWDKWAALGIVEPSIRFKGRYERIVSLNDVGLDVPKIDLSKTVKGKSKTSKSVKSTSSN
jgi:glycine cleavage system aminomethyltransferase T